MPQLTWLGDNKARRAARRVPYRLLETVQSVGDAQSENLLIQGDNLEALKSLLPLYAAASAGCCVFAMVTDTATAGRSGEAQLRAAIEG